MNVSQDHLSTCCVCRVNSKVEHRICNLEVAGLILRLYFSVTVDLRH